MSCTVGVVDAVIARLSSSASESYPMFVLLPETDPPGPRINHLLVGKEFLLHFGWRLDIEYRAVTSVEAPDGGPVIDSTVLCGSLSLR